MEFPPFVSPIFCFFCMISYHYKVPEMYHHWAYGLPCSLGLYSYVEIDTHIWMLLSLFFFRLCFMTYVPSGCDDLLSDLCGLVSSVVYLGSMSV